MKATCYAIVLSLRTLPYWRAVVQRDENTDRKAFVLEPYLTGGLLYCNYTIYGILSQAKYKLYRLYVIYRATNNLTKPST